MSNLWNRYLAIAAVSAFSAGFAASVGAADPMTSTSAAAGADMTTLDTDKDGQVSKKEASKNKDLTKKFSSLDANKDGKLDSAEFSLFETAPAGSSSPAPSNPYDPSSSSTTPKP